MRDGGGGVGRDGATASGVAEQPLAARGHGGRDDQAAQPRRRGGPLQHPAFARSTWHDKQGVALRGQRIQHGHGRLALARPPRRRAAQHVGRLQRGKALVVVKLVPHSQQPTRCWLMVSLPLLLLRERAAQPLLGDAALSCTGLGVAHRRGAPQAEGKLLPQHGRKDVLREASLSAGAAHIKGRTPVDVLVRGARMHGLVRPNAGPQAVPPTAQRNAVQCVRQMLWGAGLGKEVQAGQQRAKCTMALVW